MAEEHPAGEPNTSYCTWAVVVIVDKDSFALRMHFGRLFGLGPGPEPAQLEPEHEQLEQLAVCLKPPPAVAVVRQVREFCLKRGISNSWEEQKAA